MSPSNYLQNGSGCGGNGRNWIEHPVSKLDTLAGVAIKYGVEVADIKRMNGLATDLQMFALKTLRIPLPGRHPPSHSPPNGSANSGRYSPEKRRPHSGQSSTQEPFQSLRLKAPRQRTASAMASLQAYYGLESSNPKGRNEETELAVYRSASGDELRDDWLPKASPISEMPSNQNHRSRNFEYDLLNGDGRATQYYAEIEDGGGDKSDEKSVRRRQKAEVDNGADTPDRLLKQETSGGSSAFSSAGKSLATRPKSASRAVLFPETESGWLDSIPMGLGESIITDVLSGVRKSLSASSLKDQEKSNSGTVWPTGRWTLKPDLQALSSAAIASPIFNGLPIPISGRRNKAARD
ncbi:uncharacterized protein LOC114735522 [Neltuma alba]|uniref:uncharacterized protein LOC114735522 n=1 Tax=Neltuma alba TaxID=207710 RepID=UPI0010A2C7C2|nr:uncharacterized protein LOC114735522 [Prosopis alba]XP_028779066.1 uncharacterized protein LOC114735522 [Prosopis alba]